MLAVCVDEPSVCDSGSMSLVLCFFSSVGQFVSSLLGYVFLFSLGMLVPGVFISPLPSVVNRLTEWHCRAIDVLCCRYWGVFGSSTRVDGRSWDMDNLFGWMDQVIFLFGWMDEIGCDENT